MEKPQPECVFLGNLGAVVVFQGVDGVVVAVALGVEGVVHVAGLNGHGVGV